MDTKNDPLMRRIAVALFLLICCVSAVAVFVVVRTLTNQSQSVPDSSGLTIEQVNVNHGLTESEPVGTAEPSGKILFSTLTEPGGPMQVYTIDVASENAEEMTPFADSLVLTAFAETDNPADPSRIIFNAYSDLSEGGFMGVGAHVLDLHATGTDRLRYLESAEGGLLTRLFSWSPTDQFVAFSRYVGVPSDYRDLIKVENWEVVVIDVERDEVVLTLDDAMQPVWSPDGDAFLYLEADGLYMYDFVFGTSARVLGLLEGDLHAEGMYDVSVNGKYLVWTSAEYGVAVFEILSWQPFEIVERGRIVDQAVEYYWPQFSPDSQFYAVQAIDTWNENGERTNPRFEIRAVLNRSVLKEIPLTGHDFNAFFTDDWAEGLPQ